MIILNRDPAVAARELCDRDLRGMMKKAGNLAFKASENRSDENDLNLRWVCRSPANLKWTTDYAKECEAELTYRFGNRLSAVAQRVLRLPDIQAGPIGYLPSEPRMWRDHYRRWVAPKSIWPDLLWKKRYPPDWLATIIFPDAAHY